MEVEKEKPLPIVFEEVILQCGYRIELLVGKQIAVELKSVKRLHELHLAQVLTNLKLGHYHLGLLINFNVPGLRDGIRKVINN